MLFLDDDDRLTTHGIARMVESLSRHPEVSAVVGGYVEFDSNGRRRRGAHPRRSFVRPVWPDLLLGWIGGPSRTLFRTEVVQRLGGYRQGLSYGEDWDLLFRSALRGPVSVIPYVVQDRRIHGGQSRPEAFREIDRRLRREGLSTLPERWVSLGLRLIEGREHFVRAQSLYLAGRPRASLDELFRFARLSGRWAFTSLVFPLWFPTASHSAVAWIAPEAGTRFLRASARRVRHLMRQDVGADEE